MKVGDLVKIKYGKGSFSHDVGIVIEPDEIFPDTRTIVLWDGERHSIPTFQLEVINESR